MGQQGQFPGLVQQDLKDPRWIKCKVSYSQVYSRKHSSLNWLKILAKIDGFVQVSAGHLIKTKIGTKVQHVISTHKVTRLMVDVNSPKLEAHLLMEKDRIGRIVRKDEAKSVAVCDRGETNSP